ncbi:MAG: hypothetical protein OXC40_05485, partial [Proteobacteria bacterium]|nr:hypothetical protein [Pseudomonadota bacterium]
MSSRLSLLIPLLSTLLLTGMNKNNYEHVNKHPNNSVLLAQNKYDLQKFGEDYEVQVAYFSAGPDFYLETFFEPETWQNISLEGIQQILDVETGYMVGRSYFNEHPEANYDDNYYLGQGLYFKDLSYDHFLTRKDWQNMPLPPSPVIKITYAEIPYKVGTNHSVYSTLLESFWNYINPYEKKLHPSCPSNTSGPFRPIIYAVNDSPAGVYDSNFHHAIDSILYANWALY